MKRLAFAVLALSGCAESVSSLAPASTVADSTSTSSSSTSTTTTVPATTTTSSSLVPAVRINPPETVAVATTVAAVAGRCVEWEPLLAEYAPEGGWDVVYVSGLSWRESRCDMTARSTTDDTCALQINDVNLPYLRRVLGEWVDRFTLTAPVQCIRAAAALCSYWRNAGSSCYQPWKVS